MKSRGAVFVISLVLLAFPWTWTPQGRTEEVAQRFLIVVNEKWGYIDQTGAIVIEPQFGWAREFSEGLAAIRLGDATDGRWGYIDPTGAVVSPPQFAMAEEFSEGLAAVTVIGGKDGYIDSTGKIIIEPHFDLTFPFSEGLAAVAVTSGVPKEGFIDKIGKFVIELPPGSLHDDSSFSEGLAAVMLDQKHEKFGYIDRSGQVVIKPRFEVAARFSGGLAAVGNTTFGGLYASAKIGYIDRTGTFVIRPKFGLVPGGLSDFSEGLTLQRSANGKWGFIDKTGRFVIAPQFDVARPFSEGLAAVFIGDERSRPNERLSGKWGFIDKTGTFVIEPQFAAEAIHGFEYTGQFSNGLAKIAIGMTRRETWGEIRVNIARWGYIDKIGRLVWEGEQVWKFTR